jgi:hypothetical protein
MLGLVRADKVPAFAVIAGLYAVITIGAESRPKPLIIGDVGST